VLGLVAAFVLVAVMVITPAIGAASSGSSACVDTHVVKKGDTVAKIAHENGLSVAAIVNANHLPSADRIYVGQKLCIPGGGHPKPDPKPSNIPTKGNTDVCVTGQVIDKMHKGIPGLQVVAEQESVAGLAVESDADGYFKFEELEDGIWNFRVVVPDSWKAVTPAEFQIETSYDKVGCYPIRFKLQPLGCVIVYKKDAEGRPVADWPVRVSGPIDPEAKTDENGMARFNELVPGTYLVDEQVLYPWKPLTPKSVSVDVKPAMDDQDCAVVEFVNEKQPTSCIIGQKVDDNHNGVAGWTIHATSAEGYEAEPQVTDDEGYFIFENLTLGTWTLEEEVQDGWTPVTPSKFKVVLTTESTDQQCVPVRFKNRAPDLCAEGFKVDEHGKGLAGWTVYAYPLSNPDMRLETLTDTHGRFRFNGLTLDDWIFEVEHQTGWKPINTDFVKVPIEAGKQCTQVPIFRNQSPRGCIEGYKRDDLQVGLPGWNISLQPVGGGKYHHADTDGTGYFRFDNLPVGKYEVWEEMQPGWTALTPTRQTIEIKPNDEYVCETVEFINQQLERDICIDGYKLDQNGNVGLAGVAVTAKNKSTGDTMEVTTDGLGYFRFSELTPGKYEVSVSEPDGWVAVGPSMQVVTVDWPPKLQCTTVKFYDRQAHAKPKPPIHGCSDWHVVKSGDTLAKIGSHYKVSVHALLDANKIHNPDLIYKGQKLCIP
jgi:LysM repeat protein